MQFWFKSALGLIFFGLLTSAAHGVSVRAVAPKNEALIVITPDFRSPLAIGDAVCFFEGNSPFACGSVIKKMTGGDVVKLAWSKRRVSQGVVLRIAKQKRLPASLPGAVIYGGGTTPQAQPQAPPQAGPPQKTFLALGAIGGGEFIAPSAHGQFRVGNRARLGLLASYSANSDLFSKASLLGIMGTFQFLPFIAVPSFSLQALVGAYLLSSTVDEVSEGAQLITASALLEWRQPLGSGLFFSAAGGVQYTSAAQLQLAEVKVSGVKPLVLIQIGVGF